MDVYNKINKVLASNTLGCPLDAPFAKWKLCYICYTKYCVYIWTTCFQRITNFGSLIMNAGLANE